MNNHRAMRAGSLAGSPEGRPCEGNRRGSTYSQVRGRLSVTGGNVIRMKSVGTLF